MNENWPKVMLGEVLLPQNEICFIQPEVEYKEVTVSLWGKGIRLRRKVFGEALAASSRRVARKDNFILSKIDARHGACGFIPAELDGAVVTNDFPLFVISSQTLQPRWLYWISRSQFFVDLCLAASKGTTNRVRLKESKFLQLFIPLPPREEQERIVTHLDAIETRLARVKRLREEQLVELNAALASAFHKLEKEVDWMPMAEVAPLTLRQVTINPQENYTEYGVRSFYKGVFLRRKVPGAAFSWQNFFEIQADDIVFSNIMAWEKAIALANPENNGWVGNHRMLVCEPRKEIILPTCLFQYFKTQEGFSKIMQASPGTVARNKTLKANDLMAIQVPVPPMDRQQTFDALFHQINNLITIESNVKMNDALMPSLLDRIFS